MTLRRYLTADVFATRAGEGNPLAVVLDSEGLDTARMQAIAREFNYSETVFVLLPATPGGPIPIRIFTPGNELPFAGHPTVGTALMLAGERAPCRIVLSVPRGLVPVRIERDGSGLPVAEVTVPGLPECLSHRIDPARAAAALSLSPEDLGPGPAEFWSVGFPVLVVPVRDRAALSRARVDPARWPREVRMGGTLSLYPVLAGAEGYDVRMFAPDDGVPEDPATGAAAAAFSGWLARHAGCGEGGHSLVIRQGEDMGRPSRIALRFSARGGAVTEVRIAGTAVPVMKGELVF